MIVPLAATDDYINELRLIDRSGRCRKMSQTARRASLRSQRAYLSRGQHDVVLELGPLQLV